MSVEVRACAADEVVAALAPVSYYFGRTPRPDGAERVTRVTTPDRVLAAFEDGSAVGGAGSYPFELTVPGALVRAAGVAFVGVLPTHRRRGILTQLMRAQLDDVRERGEAVAYLWSSEDVIYGRFGYGMASMSGEVDLPRERSGFHDGGGRRGRVRLVGLEDALELVPPVYDRARREWPGMFSRSREWWAFRRLADPEDRRGGGGEMARAVVELDGSAAGYALYRHHPSGERGVATSVLEVIEALAVSPAATRELWRYLLDVDWVARVRAERLPLDHPLFLLLAEPRWMRFSLLDGVWVRLVDVGAALSARGYAEDGRVVFEVVDAFCPWNEGRWRLEDGAAARTDAEPDLRLDVTALGTVYLGGYTFAELWRAGRVEEVHEGAVARADALFRGDRAPWCPEIF